MEHEHEKNHLIKKGNQMQTMFVEKYRTINTQLLTLKCKKSFSQKNIKEEVPPSRVSVFHPDGVFVKGSLFIGVIHAPI